MTLEYQIKYTPNQSWPFGDQAPLRLLGRQSRRHQHLSVRYCYLKPPLTSTTNFDYCRHSSRHSSVGSHSPQSEERPFLTYHVATSSFFSSTFAPDTPPSATRSTFLLAPGAFGHTSTHKIAPGFRDVLPDSADLAPFYCSYKCIRLCFLPA